MYGRAARALVPGGHLFVTGVHVTDHGRRGPPDRERLHTPERLREALEPFFEVLRCETISYERERAGEMETVTDVVAIGRRRARLQLTPIQQEGLPRARPRAGRGARSAPPQPVATQRHTAASGQPLRWSRQR